MALFGFGKTLTWTRCFRRFARSGRTPEHTPSTITRSPTPTTTQPSGPSSDASNWHAASGSGEIPRGAQLAFNLAALEKLDRWQAGDPYWGICSALWRLLSRKRGYYGCDQNPLENALGVAQDGIEPWRYQAARIGEKCRRLRGLGRTLDSREAIVETLMDIAGHAVVAVACIQATPPDNPKVKT